MAQDNKTKKQTKGVSPRISKDAHRIFNIKKLESKFDGTFADFVGMVLNNLSKHEDMLDKLLE